jgi:hypothetical protein
MRIVLLLLAIVLAVSPSPARAQGYLEKKDNAAVEVIQRGLAKLDKVPALFDGTAIPAGANLQAVDQLLHTLTLHLKTAASGFGDLSAKGLARPEIPALKAKFDELVAYRNALAPVLAKTATEAEAAARKQHEAQQLAIAAGNKKCSAFSKAIYDAKIKSEIDHLSQLATTGHGGWGDVEGGTRHKAALGTLDALCKKPEHADVDQACRSELGLCTLPGRSAELMKRAVANVIAHHIKHTHPVTVDRFVHDKGWLQIDGFTSYTDYFTGKQTREQLKKRIAPMLVQAGLDDTAAAPLFDQLAADNAALEAKAKELAPTWDLPGDACSGAGCAQARGFVSQWYSGAPIRRFTQTQPGWKILTNDLGVPTYRERYGFALVQVKGEPLCQLRMWTLSEQHAGGGRYAAARDVSLGHVRWQTCK